MKLSEVCIERPVLATVMSLLILLFGAIALTRLPNRELPNVDPPVVSVATVYPGAAPEVIETSVTQPLEDEIIGIAGIRHVTSVSREQVSAITAEFELSHDVDEAANDVRDRVARAKRHLPEDVEEPIVSKRDSDARPVMWLALAGEGYDQIEISKIAETRVQDRLANLPGVANVIIGGERRMAMRLWIDNGRLTSHGLTVADVADALARENVDLPSGRIEGAKREFTVRTLGELRTARDFEEMVVAKVEGGPVRLRDVARVEVGPEDERKLIRFNGRPAVGLGVVKLSRANTLSVTDAVRGELEGLQRELPDGVELVAAWDSSIYIRRSMRDVTRTLFEAVALVTVVIYLFLRTLRSTVVPATAIPISIVGTFAVLYFAGFSINTLTLMGLTLAIGLVVDDAIVVLENITRWVEQGTPPREAARQGMKEISFAVVASTVSVVAVFLPLAFLTDTTGRLFREFGVTVAAAVGISGFVALTLSPALCARVLHRSSSERGVKAVLARGFEALAAGYAALLRPSLARRGMTVAVGVAWFGLGLLLLSRIDREFVPTDDRGSLFIRTEAPEGSTLDYTDHYQRRAEAIVQGVPEVARIFSVVALGIGTPGSVNQGFFFCSLTPWEKRKRKNTAVVEEVRGTLRTIPGISAQPYAPPSLGQRFGSAPVSLVLQGPDSEALATYARPWRPTPARSCAARRRRSRVS
jgi:hydrophobe/amphiphile efflux-1 (HAE1) family protein